MFCFIVTVVSGIMFFTIAKNPVEYCKHLYKDIHEGREYIHKPVLFRD